MEALDNVARFVYLCFIDKYMDSNSITNNNISNTSDQNNNNSNSVQSGYQPIYPNNILIKR